MGKLSVISGFGDTAIEWDTKRVEVDDPDAREAVREAERIFEQQIARGSTAFKLKPGCPAERIDEFDIAAEHIIIVPRIAGG